MKDKLKKHEDSIVYTDDMPLIEVKALVKEFNNGEIKVLRGFDHVIKKGEKIVIIGPSGGGKSTFLRCLNLLEVPTSGEVYFKGQLITSHKCNINAVREKMGMVFQHFNLFPHKTIMDNLTLAPVKLKIKTKEEAEQRARELLEMVGLPDRRTRTPLSFRADRSSAWQSRVRLPWIPRCCSLTSPPRHLTPKWSVRCWI